MSGLTIVTGASAGIGEGFARSYAKQGASLMLDAIAAVFLGMTISRHGEPRVLNTLAGVMILGVLSNGLTQLSIDSYVRDILVGTIIIAAVTAGSVEKLRRN